ncbi:MAG: ImmA/IrrE family metallo-endopeptidase [Calditrichaeota bacterium]|nr:MAG: ImmA/IrrE family metallo-endopeptidase [Calditrichota bacterium]MBL1208005.1 ImmA/IrrE family metallo-endopeptidase [Calditrichota bacterium]NOG47841.1 ImmA/IrrE family metallo-endopeptidase [Calditrichota bacterium]
MSDFKPNWSSPPGETITDILSERNISEEQFLKISGLSNEILKNLLIGKESISQSIAEKLELSLGSTKDFWLNREARYQADEKLIKQKTLESWINRLPISDMIKFGWIKPSKNITQQINNCLQFFDVENYEKWNDTYYGLLLGTAFRTSTSFKSRPEAVIAWLRQGEIEGDFIECKPWNSKKLHQVLVSIRYLTREKSPTSFLPKLQLQLAECGVALSIIPSPKGSSASGATYFISPDKALIILSFRYLSDDHFWFSFFHEAAHILLHGKKSIFIEDDHSQKNKEEIEANKFAEDILIPNDYKEEFKSLNATKWREVIRFAKKIGISPGIVVGQLQYFGQIKFNQLNKFKVKYEWRKK